MRAIGFLATALIVAVASSDAMGAGILVQSFPNQATFQASPLYAYLMSLPDGVVGNSASSALGILQGTLLLPASSAGAAGTAVVNPEIEAAVLAEPTVMSGAADSASYHKLFVGLGSEEFGTPPSLDLALPPVATDSTGGYLGYDIAVFDIGKDLVSDTGRKNSERTTFLVELQSEGVVYPVGTNTNSGGDYINVILLDVTGIPGIPSTIDWIRLVDGVGSVPPQDESLDVDAVVRLNYGPTTPTHSMTWGALKAGRR